MYNKKGFTIVEVVITLIVIAILMAALASQLITFRTVTKETSNNQQVNVVQQMVDMEFSRLQLSRRTKSCEENYEKAIDTVKKNGGKGTYSKKLPNGSTYVITEEASGGTLEYIVFIDDMRMDTRLITAAQVCGFTRALPSSPSGS